MRRRLPSPTTHASFQHQSILLVNPSTPSCTLALTGLHHITAIAGDPRRNVAFYTGTLGLRLIKRTVNFDDPSTYHLPSTPSSDPIPPKAPVLAGDAYPRRPQ